MKRGFLFSAPGRFRGALPAALSAALLLAALLSLALAGSCEEKPSGQKRRAQSNPPAATAHDTTVPGGEAAATGTRQADVPVILVLGDSLAAGFGLPPDQSFPSVLQRRLRDEGYPHRVVNAGVSGDTTAGGLSRLDWVMRQRVDVMLLELGGNDGLRGRDIGAMRGNLAKIIERAQARGVTVVLAGMQMPRNYGQDYTRRYREVFPELAGKYQVALIPFILAGVALRPSLNQPDGIHPNAKGARMVADNVWKVLKGVLEK